MVDHDHNRIKSQGERKVSDEIHREPFEGKQDSGGDWTKRGNGWVSVDLVLLANYTTCNEMLDKGGKTWPPEVLLKDRLGVENTHVTQEGGRVD